MKPSYFEAKVWAILANHFHGLGCGPSNVEDDDIDKAAQEVIETVFQESCGCM